MSIGTTGWYNVAMRTRAAFGRGCVAGPLFLVGLLSSTSALADWPMARHDGKRLAASAGTSDLTAPVAFWRTYLGGSIGGGQLLTADVNGDGVPDPILASSGQIVAKGTGDQVFWKTPPRAISALAGLGDLNGDGSVDIVGYSNDHVYVVMATTGAVEWTEPDGEMGTIGSVRVGDVNGDGKPEIIVTECGCCGVNSGHSGFIWSFGAGFSSAAQLGTLPIFSCGTGDSVTLVDATGTGTKEILSADYSHFGLVSSTGAILAQTSAVGTWTAVDRCVAANLDGVPGDEMVCLLNSSDAPATNQRAVTVLRYNTTVSPATLDVVWSKVMAPDAGGDLRWVDPVVDLDGDGKMELVVSSRDTVVGWQTRIFDALTGVEFTPAIGSAIVGGTATMEVTGKRLLITEGTSGFGLTAWSFSRVPTPAVSQKWQLPNESLVTYAKPDLFALGGVPLVTVALDLDGSGLDDVVTRPAAGGAIHAFKDTNGSVSQLASLTLPPAVDPLYAWVLPGISASKPQVGLALTSGILNLLDGNLQPAKQPQDPTQPIAIGTGGYYASGAWRELSHAPRVVSLDGGKAEAIIVDDSRQALLRFDAANASAALPPVASWAVTHTYAPTIAPTLDGANPGIACIALQEPVTQPPTYRARVLRADGSSLWDVPMSSSPVTDLNTGNFNGDAVPDLVFQWNAPSDTNVVTQAISGTNGATIWETTPFFPGGGGTQSSGLSVGNWNGDALNDVYFQGQSTYVLSGATGAQLAKGGPTNTYALPLLIDPTGSGADQVLITSSFSPVSLYSSDLATALWTSSDDDRPYPYGSVAQCGTPPIPVLVEGSWAHPARIKITPLAGANLGVFKTAVLANGVQYASEAAAVAAGAFLGQLTGANVHSNLTGSGGPTAVFGSADGWLYAFDPCAGTLGFALNLGASVGEAVFGDTNGDGLDEILVTAADGYLYDIRDEYIAAPAYVWDTDPPTITSHDVDSIVTTNKLSAAWGAVQGATSYAVQVLTATGAQPVSKPLWQNVGNVTQVSLPGLALVDDTRYVFAVRAIDAKGTSVDAISNGVTVHFPGGDAGSDAGSEGGSDAAAESGASTEGGIDAAADSSVEAGEDGGASGGASGGGGCGCRTADAGGGNTGPAILLVVSLAVIGRRRRAGNRNSGVDSRRVTE